MNLPYRGAFAALFTLAALVVAAPLAAAEARTFDVTGHVDGSDFYFAFNGTEGKNPTIALKAGDTVTINYRTVDNVHNFVVGEPVGKKSGSAVTSEAGVQTFTFTVPSTAAEIEYWCDPHKFNGMVGKFTVEGATPATDGGNETPGFEVAFAALALVGVALVARRAA